MNPNRHDGDEDVRDWLHDAGTTADGWTSAFDADHTIARARARRRRHRAAVAGAAGLTVVALLAVPAFSSHWLRTRESAPGPAAAASGTQTPSTRVTTCGIADLPLPAGLAARGVTQPARVFVTAMDSSGAYVTGNAFDAQNYAAAVILWHHRVATLLPTGGLGGQVLTTMAVNAHGVVAGTGEAPHADGFAWVYRDGTATRLPDVPGYHRQVLVYGVNAAGDVLGSALSASGEHSVVVVWPAADPNHPRVQSALTDKLGLQIGAGYDGSGRLYAWSESATTPSLMTSDGRTRALALPAGYVGGSVAGVRGSWAYGEVVNEVPQNTGRSKTTDPAYQAVEVRWSLSGGPAVVIAGTPTDSQDTLAPTFVATTAGFTPYDGRFAGRTFVLPAGSDTPVPVAIDDDGSTIAGSVGPADSHDMAENTRPVLWHC